MSETSHRAFIAALAIAVIAVPATIGPAAAGGFGVVPQSAYALGTANAGAAAGGALSTMVWNPATLGDVTSFEADVGATGILPALTVTTQPFGPFPAQRFDDVGLGAVVPNAAVGYRLDPHIALGLTVNAPYGLGTRYDPALSALAALGIAGKSSLAAINVNPNVAYRFNDRFTVAFGLQAQSLSLEETAFGSPTSAYTGSTGALGLGTTLGALWTPVDGTRIGVGFRSGITNTVEGTLTGVPLPAPFPPGSTADFDGTLTVKTPAVLTVGLTQDVGEFWTLKLGGTWTNWSVLDRVPVTGAVADQLGLTSIPFDYKDNWMGSVGADYRVRPDLTLRAGLAFETAAMTDATRTFRLPDSDRVWIAAGLSWAMSSSTTIDAGYAFLKAADAPVSAGPFTGEADATAHVLSLGLRARF